MYLDTTLQNILCTKPSIAQLSPVKKVHTVNAAGRKPCLLLDRKPSQLPSCRVQNILSRGTQVVLVTQALSKHLSTKSFL